MQAFEQTHALEWATLAKILSSLFQGLYSSQMTIGFGKTVFSHGTKLALVAASAHKSKMVQFMFSPQATFTALVAHLNYLFKCKRMFKALWFGGTCIAIVS